ALKQMFSPSRKTSPIRKRNSTRLSVEPLDARIVPATLIADDTTDSLAFNTTTLHGTLRGAIQYANTHSDASYTIQLTAGPTYSLALANVSGQENANQTGDLDIDNTTGGTKSYTLVTTGAAAVIDGAGIDRVFQVIGTDVTVNFDNVTIEDGLAVDDGTAGAA